MRTIRVSSALLLATASGADAAEKFETTTSVTTYSTRAGLRTEAAPAFQLGLKAYQYKSDPVARQIVNDVSGLASTVKTNVSRSVTLVRAIPPEKQFEIVKSAGAVAVVLLAAPEGAAYLLVREAGYAVAAGTLGLFKPWGKSIEHAQEREDLSRIKPGSPEYLRLTSLGVAVVNRDGSLSFRDYRALASNRGGLGDLIHYTVRGVASPSSKWHFLSYIAGEIVSSVSGSVLDDFGFDPVSGEAIGYLYGSSAEEAALRYSSPPGGEPRYTTMIVPYGSGYRSIGLPQISLTSSLPAPSGPPPGPGQISVAPVVAAPQAVPAAAVPAFAAPAAISTWRSNGVSSVEVRKPVPSVTIITPPPDFSSSRAENDHGGSNDHSINLPKSVEIHGLGSFSINR